MNKYDVIFDREAPMNSGLHVQRDIEANNITEACRKAGKMSKDELGGAEVMSIVLLEKFN